MIHPRHPALTFALLAAASPLLTGCGNLSSPGTAAHVATGYVSHQLCAAVFVAGREPEAYYRDAIEAMGGAAAFLMRHEVDRERAEVRATIAGFAESRAIYRPPFGCVNATGTPPPGLAVAPRPIVGAGIDLPPAEPLWPPIAGDAVVEPADPALRAALARAFEETTQGPKRHTEAVVVVHRNRIVAERYANGIGIETPLAGWSAAKSATNALLGILVRQGRLAMDAPAPIAAWADPRDPRHAITPDQLLRMTSGLDAGQTLRDVSAFDPAARMLFVEHDMAAFAASRPLADVPGSRWTYTDPNTLLLSHIVRELSGGSAENARAFAQRELFDKLGMRHATFEFDAAGTPIGSSQLWAPARDWALLGLLYLHDGVAGGQRLLPPGWVDYSARQTPGSESVGYGAGFWTNRGGGAGATYRIAAGIPADAFMARGSHGQYVVIVPSQQLVVVRLGPAWTARDDLDTVARLVSETIAALPPQPQP